MHPFALRSNTSRRLYSILFCSVIPWRPCLVVQASFLGAVPPSVSATTRSSRPSLTTSMPVSTRRSIVSVSGQDDASAVLTKRRTRTTLEMASKEAAAEPLQQQDAVPPTTPVKLAISSACVVPVVAVTPEPTPSTNTTSTSTATTDIATATLPKRKKRKTAKAKAVLQKAKPPADWVPIYDLVTELRQDKTSPCDHSGCEALPDRDGTLQDFRFQVLISLMLSSQTKDAVVGEAIRHMQADGVLNVESIRAMTSQELNEYIRRVGFHNNKTKYIKQSVEILAAEYDGDIPPTAAAMMELPGVGPKMAFICENVAWDEQTGIGVDTHMHRLFNALKWVNSKTPEQTRLQLEAWLPKDKWAEVNLLWVGFGQEVQQFKPKILRKALDCSKPREALKLLKRCGLDYRKEGKKLGLEEEIAQALVKTEA